MKVLTFCAYYEPEIAASMYLLTNLFEDMANSGIEVELFAPTPTRGVDRNTVKKYSKNRYEEKCNGKLKIHRFHLMQEGTNTLGRAIRYFILNIKFIWKGLFSKADVLFVDSTPPTQGLVAAILKRLKHIPVVYNLQDIFPDSLVNTGISTKKSLLYKIGERIESITYRNADRIIVISEDFKENIIAKGVPEEKIVVIYNWVDDEAVHYIERCDNELFDEYDLDREKFYVAYCGNIGFTQNMELLVDVAYNMRERKGIQFLIVGDGAYKQKLEGQIHEKQLDNISLMPFQSYDRISEVFSIGDVGLIISKKGIGNNSVPSKTWSYMAAGRPILTSFDEDSELVKIIRKNRCGLTVVPNDCSQLIKAITTMEKDRLSLEQYGSNCRMFAESNLKRNVGTSRYIKCIKEVKDYE